VFAAAVILNHPIEGLADSKKLSEKRRNELAARIRNEALAWCIASATEAEIDALNILKASLLAMKRAIEGLAVSPSEILVDGIHCPEVDLPMRAIVGGDALVAEISAASILAKTARDDCMLKLHDVYPEYGFDRHKGYPTTFHLDALERYGPSPIHRKSFGPVRAHLR
jgi:ribonuclease HII